MTRLVLPAICDDLCDVTTVLRNRDWSLQIPADKPLAESSDALGRW